MLTNNKKVINPKVFNKEREREKGTEGGGEDTIESCILIVEI